MSGNWSETGRPQSISSVITISQPPSDPGQGVDCTTPPEVTITAIDEDLEFSDDLDGAVTDTGEPRCHSEPEGSDSETPRGTAPSVSGGKAAARDVSLAKLEGQSPPPSKPSPLLKEMLGKAISPTRTRKRRPSNGPDAVIVLKEERANTFHDFLKFVYPQYVTPLLNDVSNNALIRTFPAWNARSPGTMWKAS